MRTQHISEEAPRAEGRSGDQTAGGTTGEGGWNREGTGQKRFLCPLLV